MKYIIRKSYLQATYLTKNSYLSYIKNSQTQAFKKTCGPVRKCATHEEVLHQREYADGKEARAKMLNITSCYGIKLIPRGVITTYLLEHTKFTILNKGRCT